MEKVVEDEINSLSCEDCTACQESWSSQQKHHTCLWSAKSSLALYLYFDKACDNLSVQAEQRPSIMDHLAKKF